MKNTRMIEDMVARCGGFTKRQLKEVFCHCFLQGEVGNLDDEAGEANKILMSRIGDLIDNYRK